MSISIPLLHTLRRAALGMLVAGCAAAPSPQNTTAWRDPGFSGPQFTRVLVIGLSSTRLADQRGFENLMVAALHSIGAVAVPGWQFVSTDRTPDQATMRAAVARAGADAVLLVRPSGFTTETGVGFGAGAVAAAGPGMYVGWYEPGLVTDSYQAATIYTTLFDVRTARAVWTYNPPDYSPATLRQDASAYANDVAGMLQATGLLAAL